MTCKLRPICAILSLLLSSCSCGRAYIGPYNSRGTTKILPKIPDKQSPLIRRRGNADRISNKCEKAKNDANMAPNFVPTLSPLEAWCLYLLDKSYQESQSMKCPFFRRRYGDFLDKVEVTIKHTIIRRECWPIIGPPQATRPVGLNKKRRSIKYKGLSLQSLRTHIWKDWKPATGKGYYITGKLTTACYRDDCIFVGPDPDMPIRGLRKYVGVAAHLFDPEQSRANLIRLDIVDDTLMAEWHLQGILRLPWKPHLPTFQGKTIYHVDSNGLIARHEEFWNISVLYAFCFTLFPSFASKIWKTS